MRIQNPNKIFVPKAYTKSESNRATKFTTTETEGTVKTGKGDSVTLSTKTMQLQKISASMDAPQENRAEKINSLKESIARGNYNVDPEKIAEKFLNAFSI